VATRGSQARWDPAKHPRGPGGLFATVASAGPRRRDPSEGDLHQVDDPTRQVIDEYMTSAEINRRLRVGTLDPGDHDWINRMDIATQTYAFPEDTVMYRGVAVGRYEGDDQFSRLQPGDQIIDRGYTSISWDRNTSQTYAGMDGRVFEVEVPQGALAAVAEPPGQDHWDEEIAQDMRDEGYDDDSIRDYFAEYYQEEAAFGTEAVLGRGVVMEVVDHNRLRVVGYVDHPLPPESKTPVGRIPQIPRPAPEARPEPGWTGPVDAKWKSPSLTREQRISAVNRLAAAHPKAGAVWEQIQWGGQNTAIEQGRALSASDRKALDQIIQAKAGNDLRMLDLYRRNAGLV
jgi:hypothetical protein